MHDIAIYEGGIENGTERMLEDIHRSAQERRQEYRNEAKLWQLPRGNAHSIANTRQTHEN